MASSAAGAASSAPTPADAPPPPRNAPAGVVRLAAELWTNHHVSERQAATKLLLKILDNIVANPAEPKFRSLNYAKILSRVADIPEATALLTAAGFLFDTAGELLVLAPEADVAVVATVRDEIRYHHDREAEEHTRDHRERMAALKKQQDAAKKEKDRLKAQIKQAKKERTQSTVTGVSSKATNREFGATFKKFEPPAQPKGGG